MIKWRTDIFKFINLIVLGFEQVLGEQSSPAELAEQLVFFILTCGTSYRRCFSLILLLFYIYDRIKLIVFGLDFKFVPKHGQIVIRDCQTKTAAIVAA